jgi:fluoroacetyl-CoA thioesterase
VLEPGLEGVVERTVTEDMTATALGSGDVAVLGTPAVLALVEAAACRALEGHLAPGETSVGSRVDLTHLAPTGVGAVVRATADLREVDGRTLAFDVRLTDPGGEVARGSHVRVLVRRERFLETARRRLEGQPEG